jgi:predicted DNA-binding transcriptional regulator AlpA
MSQASTGLSRDEVRAGARTSRASIRGPPPEQISRRLLSFPELKSVKGIGFSRQYLHRLIAAQKFPAPIHATDNGWFIAWLEHEVDAWIDARATARDQKNAAQQDGEVVTETA